VEVRIAPAPVDELGPLARVVGWGAGRVRGGEPPRIFTTLGRHRRLLRAWLPFAGTMLMRTRLPRPDVELVVLRTACNCTSPYEWVQHVPLARKAGVVADVVAAVPAWRENPAALSPRQGLLLSATDELHEHRAISSCVWRQLGAELDERQLIELCMLVGHYEMVAMTLNSLGVEPEPAALEAITGWARAAADSLTAARDLAAS